MAFTVSRPPQVFLPQHSGGSGCGTEKRSVHGFTREKNKPTLPPIGTGSFGFIRDVKDIEQKTYIEFAKELDAYRVKISVPGQKVVVKEKAWKSCLWS